MKSEAFSAIFYTLLFGLMINGCVHSCKKHKDDPVWLQETPAVAYRGVEFFWHNDFAGVDWKERLEADVRTCIVLMDEYSSKENADDIATQIENFSKKIEDYPKDKFNYLKNAASTYMRFTKTMGEDVTNYLTALKNNTPQTPGRSWNAISKPHADSLLYIYKYNEMEAGLKYIDSIVVASSASPENISNTQLEQGKLRMGITYTSLLTSYKLIFKQEFH